MNGTASNISETLYNCAHESKLREGLMERESNEQCRWQRILENKDQAKLWQAINWRGEITETYTSDNSPSDVVFKDHFEEIFNPPNTVYPDTNELRTHVSIPVLDDPIYLDEVMTQIRKLKPNKASGPDGVPPGLLKILPVNWVMFITTLFNTVFISGFYPIVWSTAKLFTIHKYISADPGRFQATIEQSM